MKLLFDENLSHRLVHLLRTCFPDSLHVREIQLHNAPDHSIWLHAKSNDLTISKDSDFESFSLQHGHPPKFILLKLGNCSTQEIFEILRNMQTQIEAFGSNPDASMMIIS